MSIFRKGDKVRRTGESTFRIDKGGIYTVSECVSPYLLLKEDPLHSHSASDFELVQRKYPNDPHPHKDLIMAWANGAEIESKIGGSYWGSCKDPSWCPFTDYRIKPEVSKRDQEIQDIQDQMKALQQRMDNLKDNQDVN